MKIVARAIESYAFGVAQTLLDRAVAGVEHVLGPVADRSVVDGLLGRLGVETAHATCTFYCYLVRCPGTSTQCSGRYAGYDYFSCHNRCTGLNYAYCFPNTCHSFCKISGTC